MQHDHESSKADGASGGQKASRRPEVFLPSNARAVYQLQRAAGNRAVAQMLSAPSPGTSEEAEEVDLAAELGPGPVSVQRDELVDAVKTEMEGRNVDFRLLARALLSNSDTLAKEETGTRRSDRTGKKGTEGTGTGRYRSVDTGKISTKEELDTREKKLRTKLTPEEIERRNKMQELDELEGQQREDEELQQREKELRHKLTPQEIARRNKKDELDDLEKQQKDAEELRQFERQRKPLNPEGKSFGQLLKGRKF